MIRILIIVLSINLNIFAQSKPTSKYFEAENLFFSQEYEKALKICDSILDVDPFKQNALILSGHIFLHLEIPDSAEKKFLSVLHRNHQNASAYNGLGLVYYQQINSSKRIVQLFKSIFIETNETKSENMFLRALKYDESYVDARYNLARLYLKSYRRRRLDKR